MNLSEAITGQGLYQTRDRAHLRQLPDDEQRRIAKAFARHKKACEALEINVDPNWMIEAVFEATQGRKVI